MSPRVVDDATREARERVISRAALDFIRDEGIGALTIDKIVARVPYSKGTVYGHFSSKEDLLTGLCNQCVDGLYELFSAALAFDGNSRERILSVAIAYMLYASADPTRFMLVITAKTPSTRAKASPVRAEKHLQLEGRLNELFLSVINDAIARGDLTPPAHMSPPQVAFALWAMVFGTIALLQDSLERCAVRTDMQLERELVNHSHLILDGLGWLPLSQEFDWAPAIAGCRQRVAHLIAPGQCGIDRLGPT